MKKRTIAIILILIWIFFSTSVYAEGGRPPWEVAMWIINVIQLIWVVPAILAWRLMTNDLLYGAFMWFDQVLWSIWNLTRTFANYAIWFMFLIAIFKYIYTINAKNDITNVVTKLLVATLLVNSSWFIIWVLIDLSILLTAWIWSLPATFITKNSKLPDTIPICTDIKYWNFLENPTSKVNLCEGRRNAKQADLLSTATNASWPLMYIWLSVIRLSDIANTPAGQSLDFKNMSIGLVIKLMIAMMFFIPIITLCIINTIRLFWIWIYISFWPLLFLNIVFGTKHKWPKNVFTLSNMIWMIFQPVLVVAALAIAAIFISSIQAWFLGKNDEWLKSVWITLDSNWWKLSAAGKEVFELKWNIWDMWNDVGWALGYIMLSFISLFMLWAMLKASFSATDIWEWIAKWISKFTEQTLKAVPIFGWAWIWALQKTVNKEVLKRLLVRQWTRDQEEKTNTMIDNFMSKLWWVEWWIKDITTGERNDMIKEVFNIVLKKAWPELKKLIILWDKKVIPTTSTRFQSIYAHILWKIDEQFPVKNLIDKKNRDGWRDNFVKEGGPIKALINSESKWSRFLAHIIDLYQTKSKEEFESIMSEQITGQKIDKYTLKTGINRNILKQTYTREKE